MQVRVTPIGVMDKDTEPQYLRDRNYEDAHDIRMESTAGGSAVAVTNNKGNSSVIVIPDYVSSVKTYRCTFDIQEEYSGGVAVPNFVTVRLADSGLPGGYFEDFHTFNSGPYTVTDYGIELKAFLQTLDNAFYTGNPFTIGPTFIDPVSTTKGYFDIIQNEVVDNDFELLVQLGNGCSFTQISEYIATSTDYSMKIVGMQQVDTDMFVALASNDNKISEMGVITHNENLDAYTYTRLLRSSKIGFRTDHQVQMEGEKNQDRISIYLTDINSKPRAFYFNKPYGTDGALAINGGDYNFTTLDSETYFFLPLPNATVDIVSVNDRGGALSSGNKRYTGRFLTSSLVGTEFLYPTNPVNIFPVDSTEPWKIAGGAPGELTTKSVSLKISNIPSGAYEYFELVVIEYSGGIYTTKIVQRYPLGDLTEIDVQHTDLGQDNAELSQAELLAVTSKYDTVGSICLYGGKMFMANLGETPDLDLTEWASAIKHSLERTSIDAVGLFDNTAAPTPGYRYGEYQNPQNVLHKTGYMWNDTYRFGIQVKWKTTGKWSRVYHIDDIRFDFSTTNVTGTTRTVNVADLNLTDYKTEELYVHYPKFTDIDLDYDVNGTPLYNLIEAYRIVRAERIPEVLATGLFFMAAPDGSGKLVPGDYPYIVNTSYPYGLTDYSDTLFFLSPDVLLGNYRYDFTAGDKLKLVAPFNITTISSHAGQKTVTNTGGTVIRYGDLTGYFDTNVVDTELVVDDYVNLDDSETKLLDSTVNVTKHYSSVAKMANVSGAFQVPSTIFKNIGTVNTKARDTGVYYGQIFRDKGGSIKYPTNKELTAYESTGHLQLLTNDLRGKQTAHVFGGDVFIQKTHCQFYMHTYTSPVTEFGSGIGFYSQNVVNTQMRNILVNDSSYGGAGNIFPQLTDKNTSTNYNKGTWACGLINWLSQWPEFSNQKAYNTGYNFLDRTITEQGYDVNSTYNGKRPASIIWSQTKTSGSLKDNYRIFKPADIYDLDLINGEISHIMELNGALYSWQRDSFMRQYVNEASIFNGGTGSDIIVGAGGVFNSPGVEFTSLGATCKWSIIRGRNPNGKDTAYWYSPRYKKLVRFTGAGIDVISDKGLKSYLTNNTNFLTGKNEPITNYGVNGVWNDRYNEAIFTFKSYNDGIDTLAELGEYVIGNEVINPDAPVHISGLPYIYKCIANVTVNAPAKMPGTGVDSALYWKEIAPTDSAYSQYFTIFTLVWNEIYNGFRCFHNYWPYLYATYNGSFLSVEALDTNTPWLHDSNTYTYYGGAFTPSITSVMNIEENIHKVYEAVQFNTEAVPYTVDFTTKTGTSTLSASDFVLREDFYYSPIKNQASGGVVTGDTGRLHGKYVKVKLSFVGGVAQRLVNFIIKFRPSHRLYNR